MTTWCTQYLGTSTLNWKWNSKDSKQIWFILAVCEHFNNANALQLPWTALESATMANSFTASFLLSAFLGTRGGRTSLAYFFQKKSTIFLAEIKSMAGFLCVIKWALEELRWLVFLKRYPLSIGMHYHQDHLVSCQWVAVYKVGNLKKTGVEFKWGEHSISSGFLECFLYSLYRSLWTFILEWWIATLPPLAQNSLSWLLSHPSIIRCYSCSVPTIFEPDRN